ncbi:MAG: hypothetical protein J5857_12520, partial [Treponema sp.]|nr:hypothetical protein [Treponema sp.]
MIRNLFLLLILPFTLLLSSCEFWQVPVRDYLEKWTSEIAIDKFEVDGVETYYDKDGNLCVGSENDAPMILYLRNPHHYVLGNSSMVVGDEIQDTYGYGTAAPYIIPEYGDNTLITQDSDDTTILRFTYPSTYLETNDGGGEIGKTITIQHPYNGDYRAFTFSLKCNSKPPKITNAAIMRKEVNSVSYYVLAFDCPDTSGIHNDIASITINGTSYTATPNPSGTLTFEDTDKFQTGIRGQLEKINKEFQDTPATSVYFVSGEQVVDFQTKTYTIGFTDAAGLKSSITLDTATASVAAPKVYDNESTQIGTGVNTIHIDYDGVEYSTVTIHAPTKDVAENDLENQSIKPTIKWTLYNDDNYTADEATQVPANTITSNTDPNSGNVTLQIPNEGHYVLKVHAEKEGYLPSIKSTYKLNLEYAQLKAPVVKNTTNGANDNLVSSNNNYIALYNNFVYVKILLPDQTVDEDNINSSGAKIYYKWGEGTTPSNYSFTPNGSDTTIPIGGYGQYYVTVYGSKPGYRDSDPVTYLIKAYNSDLYVKSLGNDTDNDGSSNKPYA